MWFHMAQVEGKLLRICCLGKCIKYYLVYGWSKCSEKKKNVFFKVQKDVNHKGEECKMLKKQHYIDTIQTPLDTSSKD